jgi:hypothetical protein
VHGYRELLNFLIALVELLPPFMDQGYHQRVQRVAA